MDDSQYVAAEGLPAAPGSNPPLTGLPVDPVPGGWGDHYTTGTDAQGEPPQPAASTPPLTITPTPLIGAIPFGGIVQNAGAVDLGDNTTAPRFVNLGSGGIPKPTTIGVFLHTTAAAGTFELMGDQLGDAPGAGFVLPIGAALPALWLPLRRMTIRNVSGAAGPFRLFYAFVTFPVHDQ